MLKVNYKIHISAQALVERLFQTSSKRKRYYIRTISQICEGILGARSPLLSDIARIVFPNMDLSSAIRGLSRLLSKAQVPWDDLREEMLAVAAAELREDDFIAFDPGDITKPRARKMEGLHKVHDGSEDTCEYGFEVFSAEVISYRCGRVLHFPIYQAVSTAGCEDYLSQNGEIAFAVHAILSHVNNRGIWLFDRAHDRSILFKKIFFIKTGMRWILRANENRVLELENGRKVKIFDHANELLKGAFKEYQITAPQRSGYLKTCNFAGKLLVDNKPIEVTIVAAQDVRNEGPVLLITPLKVVSDEMAIKIFSHYLTRWGKEEGYRFEKSFLNLEKIRTHKLEATRNLALLVQLVYLWVAITYRSAPTILEAYADQALKHETSIDSVSYRYYRVAQAMRHQLFEQYPQRAKYLMSLSAA